MKDYLWSGIIEKAYSYPLLKSIIEDVRKGFSDRELFMRYLNMKKLKEGNEEDRKDMESFYERMEKEKFQIISIYDKSYVKSLKEIDVPPAAFYFKGKEDILRERRYIGAVGSRKAREINLKKTKNLAKALEGYGVTAVSGLALGIDGACHEGSFSSIGVIGNGIDLVYPKINAPLYAKLKEKGGVISEFPLGKKHLKYHFPRRNRIITGLCEVLVVMECKIKSRALITLDYTLDLGKDIFIPSDLLKEDFAPGYDLKYIKNFYLLR